MSAVSQFRFVYSPADEALRGLSTPSLVAAELKGIHISPRSIPLRQPLTLGEAERTELPTLHSIGGMFTDCKKTLRKTMKPVLLAEAKAKTKRLNMVVCYRNQPTR